MSQTETLLLVMLGFSLAALIFLFAGRVLWALALRLGARRMQRQVPTTLAGLQSERDRLRAEYAKLSQKLGAKLDGVRAQMVEQMAEVSRHRNRLAQLTVDLNARDADIAAHKTKIGEFEAGLAEAMAQSQALRSENERHAAELVAAQNDIAALRQTIADRDRQIASLTAPAMEVLPPAAASLEAGLQARIDALTSLSQQIAAARAGDEAADPEVPLEKKLEQATRETASLQQELARLDATWSTRLDELEAGAPAEGGVENVISLAQRIRNLQKDTAG